MRLSPGTVARNTPGTPGTEPHDQANANRHNESIKAGIDGQPVFWAKENGLEVGTRFQIDPEKAISGSDLYIETKKKAIKP